MRHLPRLLVAAAATLCIGLPALPAAADSSTTPASFKEAPGSCATGSSCRTPCAASCANTGQLGGIDIGENTSLATVLALVILFVGAVWTLPFLVIRRRPALKAVRPPPDRVDEPS